MKRAIKAIIASIFITCLNISYVTANPFPEIKEFVNSGSPNRIQQVRNSKWCVPTCTDIAAAYISRVSGAELTDVPVQHNILVNGAVHENITNYGLDLDDQFEAIQIGARIIPFISSAPMARIKDLVYNNDARTGILSYDGYNRSERPFAFLKNILYKRPAGQRSNWKSNNNICVIMDEYLHKELTAFTDKDTEEEVDKTLNQFVSSLEESNLQQLYSLNKAIPCLQQSLNLLGIQDELNKWFQRPELAAKIGNIQCECKIKNVQQNDQQDCFNDIFANAVPGNVIILDFQYANESGGGHACIVTGKGSDATRQFLEVYNPDPSYGEMNPMLVNNSLTYTAPGGKKRVASRYVIIKYRK